MISSIILLKIALDALPLLAMVFFLSYFVILFDNYVCDRLLTLFALCPMQALKDAKCFLLSNIYKTVCENDKYASIRKRYATSGCSSRH